MWTEVDNWVVEITMLCATFIVLNKWIDLTEFGVKIMPLRDTPTAYVFVISLIITWQMR
jgi:hypothetical protein